MKVLHLLSSTGYHGAEHMAAELIRQLSTLGVKNYIGVFDNKRSNTDILKAVQPFVEEGIVFPCEGRLSIKAAALLRNYATRYHIDILHSHKYKTNFYSLLASVRTRLKLISTCHNWLGDSVNMRFYAALDKRILRGFDAVVGVSNEVVAELKRHVAAAKITKIENGIDTVRYSRPMERNAAKHRLGLEGKRVVGFVGRLSSDKGLLDLMRAMHDLIVSGLDLHALIVGDGDIRESLEAEARSLGLQDRIVFTGKRSDTPLIYAALDVFALPSLKEAFPMVILEAMACGVPIVACRVGDIPEILQDHVSGLLIEPKDAAALARSIAELLSNPGEADRLARAAGEKVRDRYSSVRMAKQYQAVYAQTLAHRGARN